MSEVKDGQIAQRESVREAELLDAILTGKTWLSSPWTLAINVLFGLVPAVAAVWVATRLITFSTWPTPGAAAILVLVGSLLGVLGVRFLTLKRAVVRGEELEIHSFLRRRAVRLTDIDRVRWNDAQGYLGSRHLAVIEKRVGSGKILRISLLPHSIPIMRAFAAHVGAIQCRADVADPAYVSNFYLGSGEL